MKTPIGISVISDVMPLQASATKSDSSPGSVSTLPSRKIATPKSCSSRTAAALTISWSSTISGVTQAGGNGIMKTR